jgi:hypothetical protein
MHPRTAQVPLAYAAGTRGPAEADVLAARVGFFRPRPSDYVWHQRGTTAERVAWT